MQAKLCGMKYQDVESGSPALNENSPAFGHLRLFFLNLGMRFYGVVIYDQPLPLMIVSRHASGKLAELHQS